MEPSNPTSPDGSQKPSAVPPNMRAKHSDLGQSGLSSPSKSSTLDSLKTNPTIWMGIEPSSASYNLQTFHPNRVGMLPTREPQSPFSFRVPKHVPPESLGLPSGPQSKASLLSAQGEAIQTTLSSVDRETGGVALSLRQAGGSIKPGTLVGRHTTAFNPPERVPMLGNLVNLQAKISDRRAAAMLPVDPLQSGHQPQTADRRTVAMPSVGDPPPGQSPQPSGIRASIGSPADSFQLGHQTPTTVRYGSSMQPGGSFQPSLQFQTPDKQASASNSAIPVQLRRVSPPQQVPPGIAVGSFRSFAEANTTRGNPYGDFGVIGDSPARNGKSSKVRSQKDVLDRIASGEASGASKSSASNNQLISESQEAWKRDASRTSVSAVWPAVNIVEHSANSETADWQRTQVPTCRSLRAADEYASQLPKPHALGPLGQHAQTQPTGIRGNEAIFQSGAVVSKTEGGKIDAVRDALAAQASSASIERLINAVPSEARKLKIIVSQLAETTGAIPSAHPYSVDHLREYFYKQVFGNAAGFEQMSRGQATLWTELDGEDVNVGRLRQDMLATIENVVEIMARPPDVTLGTQQSRAHVEASSRQATEPSGLHSLPEFGALPVEQAIPTELLETKYSNTAEDFNPYPIARDPLSPLAQGVASVSMLQQDPQYPTFQQEASFGGSQGYPGTQGMPYQQPPAPNVNPQPLFQIVPTRGGGIQLQPLGTPPGPWPIPYYPNHQPMPYYSPPYMYSHPAHGYPTYGQQQHQGPFARPPFIPQQHVRQAASQGFTLSQRPFELGRSPSFIPGPGQSPVVQRPNHRLQRAIGSGNASAPLIKNVEWANRFGRQLAKSPGLPLLPYRAGSDDMFPRTVGGSSITLQQLTRHGIPNHSSITNEENLPFAEVAKNSNPAEWGVVRIGNIPYSLTTGEVMAFLGRNAKLVTPDLGWPVHIIMDRTTGKTMDCYVEFFSNGDASAAVNKCKMRGHQLRLSERSVEMELSSQDELLKQMFPRAKNVIWRDGKPIIEKPAEPFNTGFKCFITPEELTMLVRHAEQPHRSSYTQKCLQRSYECLISTLYKFPWYSVDNYTLATRNQLFAATRDQLKALLVILKHGGLPQLSETLFTDLLMAGLNAPGFSERQRWELCQAAERVGSNFRLSPLARWWPFEVLGRRSGVDEDVVEYYAHLFTLHPSTSLSESPFGKIALDAERPQETTIHEVGRAELQFVYDLLRGVLA